MEAALKVLSPGFPGCSALACKSKQLILAAGRWTAIDCCYQPPLLVSHGLSSGRGRGRAGGASREQCLQTGAPGALLFSLYPCDSRHRNDRTRKSLTQQNEDFHLDSMQGQKPLLDCRSWQWISREPRFRHPSLAEVHENWTSCPLSCLVWQSEQWHLRGKTGHHWYHFAQDYPEQ